jgi:hypothetical protein
MTSSGEPSRLRTALFGPSTRPRFPGDLASEVAREIRRSFRWAVAALVCVAALGIAMVALPPSPDAIGGGLVLTLFGAPIAATVLRLLVLRRRAIPAGQVLAWQAERQIREWSEIDGGDLPATPDEGLARLEGRTDDLASIWRVVLLTSAKRHEEARAALASWRPIDPTFRARRERANSVLDFADGTDDLGPVWEAAGRLLDESDRRDQEVALHVEVARRKAVRGEDPLPELVEARRRIGQMERPTLLLARTRRSPLAVALRLAGMVVLGMVLLPILVYLFGTLILGVMRLFGQ